jgi:hypothetical protein
MVCWRMHRKRSGRCAIDAALACSCICPSASKLARAALRAHEVHLAALFAHRIRRRALRQTMHSTHGGKDRRSALRAAPSRRVLTSGSPSGPAPRRCGAEGAWKACMTARQVMQ